MSLLARSISVDYLTLLRGPKESLPIRFNHPSPTTATYDDLVMRTPRSDCDFLTPPDFLIGYPEESDTGCSYDSDENFQPSTSDNPAVVQSIVLSGPAATAVRRLKMKDDEIQVKAMASWAEKAQERVPELSSYTTITSSDGLTETLAHWDRFLYSSLHHEPPRLRRARTFSDLPSWKTSSLEEKEEDFKSFRTYGVDRTHRGTLSAVRAWMEGLPKANELVLSEW
ncbi:hypothetical protein CROQUDRAFT_674627 [Cronartium quercuum f. sp. fusiforme G11]|uniref:Uncharacterized protein n=1 Tax=Cronartium quercuum f. sp. fusiforme G11 TaxID=708437 RepID=A0A9P6N6G9_9BASI|nr:hypothetical protein CROQUDRAFT_674627 [Cronartium quercuum f. sp. fusiforme G11]